MASGWRGRGLKAWKRAGRVISIQPVKQLAVIASEARQSRMLGAGRSGLLRRCAPRNDDGAHIFVLAARNARVMHLNSPSEDGGRRKRRMLAAPAGLACKGNAHLRTQATTGQPGQPAFPAQWCYGLYVFSSVRRAFWPPSPRARHARLDLSVGRSGPHEFAVRAGLARRARSTRPSHPATHVRDDRDTPLQVARDGVNHRLIWVSDKEKYFCCAGLTSFRKISPTGKSGARGGADWPKSAAERRALDPAQGGAISRLIG